MTTTRYLEFDSTYRDRNQYPNPANFLIEISQTGQKSKENAVDPITLASPILYWNTSFDESVASLSVNITGIDFVNSPSDQNLFLIIGAQGDFRKTVNYYDGAVLQLTDTASTVRIFTRILTYKLICWRRCCSSYSFESASFWLSIHNSSYRSNSESFWKYNYGFDSKGIRTFCCK